MIIAFIVPSLGPLGPVIVVRNLVERMIAHGHECVVFYFDEQEAPMRFACETRRISFWKREDFSRFDWIHAHCFRPMVYAARVTCTKKMTTLHSYLFTEYRYSLGCCLGWMIGRFTMGMASCYDKVVVLSEDARAYYSQWIAKDKLYVCYNGVDVTTLPSEAVKVSLARDRDIVTDFKGESILIGCLCELEKIKNLNTIIRALSLLPSDYKLLLIGAGTDAVALTKLSRQLGVDERVLFLGFREEAHRFFPLVDIYAMTSRSEGFCLALVEAAMYGKVIVCADIPGMREKFSEKNITYFDVDSPVSLAEAVLYARNHGEKAVMAKFTAEHRFSSEKMYEQYKDIYVSVESDIV